MVTTILVMTNFAMFKYKYGLIGTFVDSSNANTDKTILVIVMIFCITIIVAVKFQIAHPHQVREGYAATYYQWSCSVFGNTVQWVIFEEEIFMNWPIPTFQGEQFHEFSRALSVEK